MTQGDDNDKWFALAAAATALTLFFGLWIFSEFVAGIPA